MLTTAQAAEAASKGAAVLDAEKPAWADRIDCDRLDLDDYCGCILGQLYGGYGEGLDALGRGLPPQTKDINAAIAERNHWSIEHGFAWLPRDENGQEALEDAWKAVLAERRAARENHLVS